MQPDLKDLTIGANELENLTGLEIGAVFMGRVYRPSIIRHPRRLLSFLITELLVFGLIVVFCLPVLLILFRGWIGSTVTAIAPGQFLLTAGGLSIAIAACWNLYMWRNARRMKTLAHLLDEVDKYNEIIQAVNIMDELGSIQHSTVSLINRDEVLAALHTTRESLVCALMTERILRKHQKFIARRYELFANIERNVATLQALTVEHQASEYGQLLNEALQIGMSVHREIRKIER